MFGDAPLAASVVGEAVGDGWGLAFVEVTHLPIGFGSHHWLGLTEGGARWFITADAVPRGWPVVEAYELARELADAGLDFVRAPRRDRDGLVARNVHDHWLSVWPWIDGRTREWGDTPTPDESAALARVLRRLHEHRRTPVPALIDDWSIEARSSLVTALDEVHLPWGGHYAEALRLRLATHRGRVQSDLQRYDELVSAVVARDPTIVITHGEPHVANVVHTRRGPVLIDWDMVSWAPPERDLWMVGGAGDPDALDAYHLRWQLTDVALAVLSVRGGGVSEADLEVAWHGLQAYLPE